MSERANTLFGFETPEQVRERIGRTYQEGRNKLYQQALQSGQGGLANRLGGLGQTIGLALSGLGGDKEINTEETRMAEQRQKIISGLDGEPTTAEYYSKAMKAFMDAGDMAGAKDALGNFVKLTTIESAKGKEEDKGLKTTITMVPTGDGTDTQRMAVTTDRKGNVVNQVPLGGIKEDKPPVTRTPKITKGDREGTLAQARNIYKHMDFSAEYNPEDHDAFLDIITGEVNRRAEELRVQGEPVSKAKLTREVLRMAEKEGVITKDEGFFDTEPKIDQSKLDVMFGIKKAEDKGEWTIEEVKD